MKIRARVTSTVPCLILNGLHVVMLAGKGKSFWHLICILWASNRRSFWFKLSRQRRDIATNHIRAQNTRVIWSNKTVAQLEVLFADSLAETLFCLFFVCFFSFQYKGKKEIRKNNVILFYIVRAYTCTKVFYNNFVVTIFTFITWHMVFASVFCDNICIAVGSVMYHAKWAAHFQLLTVCAVQHYTRQMSFMLFL